jgi:hypothetical protein
VKVLVFWSPKQVFDFLYPIKINCLKIIETKKPCKFLAKSQYVYDGQAMINGVRVKLTKKSTLTPFITFAITKKNSFLIIYPFNLKTLC